MIVDSYSNWFIENELGFSVGQIETHFLLDNRDDLFHASHSLRHLFIQNRSSVLLQLRGILKCNICSLVWW